MTEESSYRHRPNISWLSDVLSDDLLEYIFVFLSLSDLKNISLVCQRFYSLSGNFHTHNLIYPKNSLLYAGRIRNINLIYPADKATIPLSVFYSRFKRIKVIHLWEEDPHLDTTITQIAQSNIPLKSLYLTSQTIFPKEAMATLGRNMSKTLKSLSYIFCKALTDDDLTLIAEHFSYLNKLNIMFSTNLEDKGIGVTDTGILEISSKLKNLTLLNISHQGNLSYRSLEYLATHSYNSLKNLSIDINYDCTDCLNQFKSFSHLTTLQLTGRKIHKGVLVALSEVNLRLEKLCLEYYKFSHDIDDLLFCKFFKSLKYLRHLELESTALFPVNIEASSFVASIGHIRKIHFSSNSNSPEEHPLPPKTLFHLLKSCKLLEDIDICGNLETEEDEWLNIHVIHRSLKRLSVSHCEDLSDQTLFMIAACVCPMLLSLYIYKSSFITKEGVEDVASYHNNIEILEVESCSDDDLIEFSLKIENYEQLLKDYE